MKKSEKERELVTFLENMERALTTIVYTNFIKTTKDIEEYFKSLKHVAKNGKEKCKE